MPVNRNPKREFTRVTNTVINDCNITPGALGVLVFFLSKPPKWEMHLDELYKHFKASKNSLRSYLRELRNKDYIGIKHKYNNKKKKFAGSRYILKESDGKESPVINDIEQTYQKSRGSANSESLQNKGINNNTDRVYSNTDISIVESNTIHGMQNYDTDKEGDKISTSINHNNFQRGTPIVNPHISEYDD